MLGHAPIMPGRWRDAVRECPDLMQALVAHDPNLSIDRPPRIVTSSAVNQRPTNEENTLIQQDKKEQQYTQRQWSGNRKPMGYWSLQRLVEEVYEYVDVYRTQHDRPAVWMPRPSEWAACGRDDLRQAVTRFGGLARVARTAGMVPHRDWYYFEGQLELLLELKEYLDRHGDGDYRDFPKVTTVRERGYHQLYTLIMYFGGRKFVAARLGMNVHSSSWKRNDSIRRSKSSFTDSNNSNSDGVMQFGAFDLDFAIRLLQFVRRDQLKRNPPLQYPCLAMPSRSKLVVTGGEEGVWLDSKIDEFGGYENVARRLGLALFPIDGQGHHSRSGS